jgi:zinc transport system substrate-binding protein
MLKKILIMSVFLVLLSACYKMEVSDDQSVGIPDAKLKIATTFPPLYSFVTNITSDLAEVENLVPPGASVHTWEPQPSDLKILSDADLLVMSGLDLEPFIGDMVDSAQNKDLITVTTSEAIQDSLMEHEDDHDHEHEEEEHEEEHEGEHEEEGHHHHEGPDPHIWLDPILAMKQVELIRDKIIKLDPVHKAEYEANTEVYLGKLQKLDQEAETAFQEASPKGFITFHDAYGYFLHRYGIEEYHLASIEPYAGKEPTAAFFQELVNLIETESAKVVFTEPQFSPTTVQNLQEETGVKSFEIDPIGLELSTVAYENNMRSLTQTFIKAFK